MNLDPNFILSMAVNPSAANIEVEVMEDGQARSVCLKAKKITDLQNCKLDKVIILPHENGMIWDGIFKGIDDGYIMLSSLKSGNSIGVPQKVFTAYLEEI